MIPILKKRTLKLLTVYPLPQKKLNPNLESWGKNSMPRCKATSFTAWPSSKAIEDFFKTIPACSTTHKWECTKCGCWHYLGSCRGPSGESSGSDKRKIERSEDNVARFEKLKRLGFVADSQEDKKKESKEGRFAHL